jgi:alpha 1,2-mannosyltransferase
VNKNAIIILLNNSSKDISAIQVSLPYLEYNYLSSFNQGVDLIFFKEGDFPEEEEKRIELFCGEKNLSFKFVQINFSFPDFYTQEIKKSFPEYVKHPDFPSHPGFNFGYRHMCRFFAGAFLNHPSLSQYEYIWRLDTDSFIMDKINYDVFEKMREGNFVYGYINIQNEHPRMKNEFCEFSDAYFGNKDSLSNCEGLVYYTNFEILNKDAILQSRYMDFFNSIDESGGIYLYRWGDHIIRHSGITNLFDKDRVKWFDDIDYYHGKKYLGEHFTKVF